MNEPKPLEKPRDIMSEYPTIERLADLSQTTTGYQGPALVEEAVRCWRALTQAQARCAEARNVALEEAAEACENHAIHVSNTEDAYAACVNCARDIRTLKA